MIQPPKFKKELTADLDKIKQEIHEMHCRLWGNSNPDKALLEKHNDLVDHFNGLLKEQGYQTGQYRCKVSD